MIDKKINWKVIHKLNYSYIRSAFKKHTKCFILLGNTQSAQVTVYFLSNNKYIADVKCQNTKSNTQKWLEVVVQHWLRKVLSPVNETYNNILL